MEVWKPHEYQQMAVDRCLTYKKQGLFLDMGLGKTAISLTTIDRWMHDSFEAQRVLIIAPAQVIRLRTWENEAAKWDHLKYLELIPLTGTAKQRAEKLKAKSGVFLLSADSVGWIADPSKKLFNFDTVILDESSKFKNPSSMRFRSLRRWAKHFKRCLLLTGTPSSNSYMDLWSQIYLLDQGEALGRTLGEYRSRYFNPGRRNGHIVYDWVLKPGAKEQIDDKLKSLCFSMSAKDWLNLPDRVDNLITFDLGPQQRQNYKRLEREFVLESVTASSRAVALNKLRQLTSGAIYADTGEVLDLSEQKLDILEDIIENTDKPILVFYQFIHERDRAMARFAKLQPRELKSSQDIQDWNQGNIKLLLCHPASVGYGLNIQRGSNTIVWLSLTWSLEEYQQANARLHRQGQKETVIVHHILAKRTVDELVYLKLQTKEFNQNHLLEALKLEHKINTLKGGHQK